MALIPEDFTRISSVVNGRPWGIGHEEEARVIATKQTTRGFVFAWSNPKSRNLWLLRPNPLRAKSFFILVNVDLSAVTTKVKEVLHPMGGFNIQDDIPFDLQGTAAGREVRSSERYKILAGALIMTLTSVLFPHSPYRSDSFAWTGSMPAG